MGSDLNETRISLVPYHDTSSQNFKLEKFFKKAIFLKLCLGRNLQSRNGQRRQRKKLKSAGQRGRIPGRKERKSCEKRCGLRQMIVIKISIACRNEVTFQDEAGRGTCGDRMLSTRGCFQCQQHETQSRDHRGPPWHFIWTKYSGTAFDACRCPHSYDFPTFASRSLHCDGAVSGCFQQ